MDDQKDLEHKDIKEPVPNQCESSQKEDYDRYMKSKECEPEYFEPFEPCDFDWNTVYLQYRKVPKKP